jgi:hypothetical protein
MRTYTETKREGELLGDVDWSYKFESHFDANERGKQYCAEAVEKLRQLTNGEKWEATTDGGWPRCGWGEVCAVGMYDGWPYWRPVPSVAIAGIYGLEWSSFSSVTSIRKASVPNNESTAL